MPNAIDLCTLADVASALKPLGFGGMVTTTISSAIVSGPAVVVTPASMANIQVGTGLQIDSGAITESITVKSITGTMFTAPFALSHPTTPIIVTDQSTTLLSRLITSFSAYVLWRTSNGPSDGSFPASSPFVAPVTYNEWYDGNGNNRLFLYHRPIRTVTSLTINGTITKQSTDPKYPGWVIDQAGKSIIFRQSNGYGNYVSFLRSPWSAYSGISGCSSGFSRGLSNINVQYTAGYSSVPYDLNDAAIQAVILKFRRGEHVDQKSMALPEGGGTLTYRDWELPPEVVAVLDFYTRKAVI